MEYIKNGVQLNYEIIGEGQPMLLLHGLACARRIVKGMVERSLKEIQQPSYQRIYLDLPGMGQSIAPVSQAFSDLLLDVLISFIDEVIYEKFVLVGQSYGGYLALGLLTHYKKQIDRLLLICPMVEPNHLARDLPVKDIEIFDDAFLAQINQTERAQFCEYMVVANPETYRRYLDEVQAGMEVANRTFLQKLEANYAYTFNLKKKLVQLESQTPVLIVAGKQDICVGYKDLYEFSLLLPRSSFYLLDQAGHNLQLDQPTLLHTILANWLKSSCEYS